MYLEDDGSNALQYRRHLYCAMAMEDMVAIDVLQVVFNLTEEEYSALKQELFEMGQDS